MTVTSARGARKLCTGCGKQSDQKTTETIGVKIRKIRKLLEMPITTKEKEQAANTEQPRRSGRNENFALTDMYEEKISIIKKSLNNLDIEGRLNLLEKKTKEQKGRLETHNKAISDQFFKLDQLDD